MGPNPELSVSDWSANGDCRPMAIIVKIPPGCPWLVETIGQSATVIRRGYKEQSCGWLTNDFVIQGLEPNLVTPTQIVRYFKNTFFCLCFEIQWLFWQLFAGVRMFIFWGQIYRSTSFDRISNFFVLNHLVFILYTILKKYLDTQNEFIFNKILIIMI